MSPETPYLEFDENKFQSLFTEYSKIGTIYYPVKSNDCDVVLDKVEALGGNFEVDSIAHIKYLVVTKKISPNRILYSIPLRKEQDIIQAAKLGVNFFVIDTITEYRKIINHCKSARFIIRLDAKEFITNHEIKNNKWGLNLELALQLSRLIERDKFHFEGLSFYLPKGTFYYDNFSKVLNGISETFKNDSLNVIDIGGGLDNMLSNESYVKAINEIKNRFNCSIIVEPGRNLLNPCFNLITSVIGKKKLNNRDWLYIDSGVYSGLLDSIIQKRDFQISETKMSEESDKILYNVSGPTSDLLDFIGEHHFSAEIKEGDTLIIKNCGAYSVVMQTKFSGFNGLQVKIK
jgi:ornithine decarboxylase